MKTSTRITLVAVSAAAAAVATGFTSPSSAEPGGGKTAPVEAGCYDITGGAITFERVTAYEYFTVKPTFPHGPDLQAPADHVHTLETAVPTYKSSPTSNAAVSVTATTANTDGLDCSGVRYRLRVLDESRRLLAEVVVPGDSSSQVVWNTGFSYPDTGEEQRAAYFVGTSETSGGRVVDTAPDDAAGLLITLTEGGAQSAFK